MTNRSQRRREQKSAPKVQQDAPLIDFVIWCGDGFDPTACIASLPSEGVTVTTCGKSDGLPYAARNKAALKGRAPFLAFMDADATLDDPATLPVALAHLQNGASVVGGLLIQSGEFVFSAGYVFNVEARPYYRFAKWKPDAAKVQTRREDMQAVPLSFMLTRRDVFRVLRFHEDYQAMAYGDADYCVRARAMGPVVYEPALRAHVSGALLHQPADVAVMLLRSRGIQYDELALLG